MASSGISAPEDVPPDRWTRWPQRVFHQRRDAPLRGHRQGVRGRANCSTPRRSGTSIWVSANGGFTVPAKVSASPMARATITTSRRPAGGRSSQELHLVDWRPEFAALDQSSGKGTVLVGRRPAPTRWCRCRIGRPAGQSDDAGAQELFIRSCDYRAGFRGREPGVVVVVGRSGPGPGVFGIRPRKTTPATSPLPRRPGR